MKDDQRQLRISRLKRSLSALVSSGKFGVDLKQFGEPVQGSSWKCSEKHIVLSQPEIDLCDGCIYYTETVQSGAEPPA